MKVLMLTPSFSPIIGGTERVVQELAFNLNKNGIQTDVMTFNMAEKWKPRLTSSIEEKGFKIYRVPAISLCKRPLSVIGELSNVHVLPTSFFGQILKKYDILHYHDVVDLSFPLFSSFVKKPKIFHCHTLQEFSAFYRSNSFARSKLVKSSNLFIAVSKKTAELMRAIGATDVRVLPNGVDTTSFSYDPNISFSQDRDSKTVLFVGRIEGRKGIHVLLDSLPFLKTSINLVLVGPNYGDNYFREIISKIKNENSKGKHKLFYRGSLGLSDLTNCYKRATIFVCPSLCESFGVVNIEAMSCGTPVIASDIEGIRDIIESGKDGILVPPNDPRRLANALEYLIDDESARRRIGKAGRKKVEANFSWRVVTEELCEIYNELTG